MGLAIKDLDVGTAHGTGGGYDVGLVVPIEIGKDRIHSACEIGRKRLKNITRSGGDTEKIKQLDPGWNACWGTDGKKMGCEKTPIFERIQTGRKGRGDPLYPFEPRRNKRSYHRLDPGNKSMAPGETGS